MKFRSTGSPRAHSRAKLVALVAASLVVAAPLAQAQGLFELFEASPRQVARNIEDSGYSIRGPLIRRGDVYVCDAVSDNGRHVRLVIDARSGQVIERFAARRPAWRDGDDMDAPPRPPRGIYDEQDRPLARDDDDRPQRFARGSIWDEPLPGDSAPPAVIPGIGRPSQNAPDYVEPVKPRPHVVRRHTSPPPVATAKAAPETPKSAPEPARAVAPEPAQAAAPEPPKPPTPSVAAVAPNPPPRVAPEAAPVAPESHKARPEPVKPAIDAAKPEESKPVAEARPVEPKRPEVRPADSKPAAEVKPGQKKLNDLPVSPLD